MNNSIYDIDYTRKLPPALKNDESMLAVAQAVAAEFQKTVRMSRVCAIYPRIDELEEDMLDILAYDLHVDWYDESYPVDIKRAVIKDSVKVHKYLGTKYALETALRNVFPYSFVREWFDYDGEPFTYRLYISPDEAPLTIDTYKNIKSSIKHYVNLRSHLEWLVFSFMYGVTNEFRFRFDRFGVNAILSNKELIRGIKPYAISFEAAFNGICIWPVLLNGRYLLDGSWLLNQTADYKLQERISLTHMSYTFTGLTNAVKHKLNALRIKAAFYYWNKKPVLLNGERPLDGSWLLNQTLIGLKAASFSVKAAVNTQSKLSGAIVLDSMYYLDGSVLLDGSRRLNAEIIKEEL